MKGKFLCLLGICCAVFAASCTKTENGSLTQKPAGGMTGETFEQLLETGKKNGNKVTIYSTTSVVGSAAEAFKRKYNLDIEFESTQIGDNHLITQVSEEVSSGVKGADIIFIQDGARIVSDLVEEGLVYNWYNKEIKEAAGEYTEPLLVWGFLNKVFIFNSENVRPEDVANVWYVTDEKYRGTVQIKDPYSEGVNMDFLTQVTAEEYANQLADAYKAYYKKDIVLDSDCPNAGYQWIKMMYNNGLIAGSSDSDVIQSIGAAGQTRQWSALVTLNKYKKNLDKGYKLGYTPSMTPFAGFIYPIYGLLTANADNPDMAKAFLIWMLTEEGWYGDGKLITADGSVYTGMTGRYGDYSANKSIPAVEGDLSLDEWLKVLVKEDPYFCAKNRANVEDFINLIK